MTHNTLMPNKGTYKCCISVIVSTYASEEFIDECLQDLSSQTILDCMEIIIVDANSPENEKDIIFNYQKKFENIVYIKTATRINVYEAWNIAIKCSSGKYITPFSTNDRLKKDAYEVMLRALENNDNVALVYGDSYVTDTPHENFYNFTPSVKKEHFVWPAKYSFETLLTKALIGPHPMWRKDVHDDIGYFDERYSAWGDQDFFLRLGEKYDFLHLNEFTGLYWWADNAISNPEYSDIPTKEKKEIRSKYIKRYINRYKKQLNKRTHISVVIPVYNKIELTRQCLNNIFSQKYNYNFEIIIVDNNSTDGTSNFIDSLNEDINYIANQKNIGFAKACNQGAKEATGDYLIFLNNDTIPQKDWLDSLVNFIKNRPDVGVVGCKLLYPDNTVQHCGASMNFRGDFFRHQYKFVDRDHPLVNDVRELDAVTAACFLTPRETFLELGMFDEGYLNGCEDMDYCAKVKKAGLKIYYNPESVLYHLESQTSRPENKDIENFNYYLKKWGYEYIKNEIEIYAEDGFWTNKNGRYVKAENQHIAQFLSELRMARIENDNRKLERFTKIINRIYPVESWKKKNLKKIETKKFYSPKINPSSTKILFVCHDFPPQRFAGAQLYAKNLAQELNRQKLVKVEILYPEFRGINSKSYTIHKKSFDGLNVYELCKEISSEPEKIYNKKVAHTLSTFLKSNKYDLIHFHGLGQLSLTPIFTAHDLGIKTIMTLHDYWFLCDRWHMIRKDQSICTGPKSLKKCTNCYLEDQELEITPENFKKVYQYKKFRKESIDKAFSKLNLIYSPSRHLNDVFKQFGYHGITTYPLGFFYKTCADTKNLKPKNKITFGYAGQIIERKGVNFLVEAFKSIKNPNIELHIWGHLKKNAAYAESIINYAKSDSRIKIFGSYSPQDLPDIFKSFDIAIIPSLMENYPLVVQESFIHKTPVIATNVGGITEKVKHGVNGIIVNPGSVDAIKDAIQDVASNPDILDRFFQNITPVKKISEDASFFAKHYKELLYHSKHEVCSSLAYANNHKKGYTVQFYVYKNVHWPMFEEIYHYLQGRNDIKEIIICLPDILQLSDGNSFEFVQGLLRLDATFVSRPRTDSDITFVADTIAGKVAGCGHIVNVGHGTISKGYYFTRSIWTERENWVDLLCVPGNYAQRQLKEVLNTEVVATGMPKLDPVFSGKYTRKALCQKLDIHPEKKIVLYAPTFNIDLSSVFNFAPKFHELIRDDIYILIKLHGSTLPYLVNHYKKLAKSYSGIIYIEDPNLAPYLGGSDIMISDVSSAFMEFMALDKPVILYNNPNRKRYHGFNPENIEYKWRNLGTEVYSLDETKKAIHRLIDKKDDGKSTIRKTYAQELFADLEGCATENVWKECIRIKNENPRKQIPNFSIISFLNPSNLFSLRLLIQGLQFYSVMPLELILIVQNTEQIVQDFIEVLQNFSQFRKVKIIEINEYNSFNEKLHLGIEKAESEYLIYAEGRVNFFKNFDYILYKTFQEHPEIGALTGVSNSNEPQLNAQNYIPVPENMDIERYAYDFLYKYNCVETKRLQIDSLPPMFAIRKSELKKFAIEHNNKYDSLIPKTMHACLSLFYSTASLQDMQTIQNFYTHKNDIPLYRRIEILKNILNSYNFPDVKEQFVFDSLAAGSPKEQLQSHVLESLNSRFYDLKYKQKILNSFPEFIDLNHTIANELDIIGKLAPPNLKHNFQQINTNQPKNTGFNQQTRALFYFFKNVHIPIIKPILKKWQALHPESEIAIGYMHYAPEIRAGFEPKELEQIKELGLPMYERPQDFQPDITFIADSVYPWVRGCGKLVHIGHGLLSKGQYYTDTPTARREEEADLVCVPGKHHQKIMRRIISKPVIATGMAKLDPLFSGEISRQTVLKKYGLPGNKKYILFAPTFNDELSAIPHVKEKIADILPEEAVLLIKLHGSTRAEYKEMYRKLPYKDPRVIYVDDLDISPFLALADVLITDVSSTMFEFAALDKPVVLFDSPDWGKYENYNPKDIEFTWRDFALRTNTLEEMGKAVKRSLEQPAEFSGIRTKYTQLLLANQKDGGGAERIVEAAHSLIQEPTES